jgi:excisionase family DNA binding protein
MNGSAMHIGVSEYATSLGISNARVIQLIHEGRLEARRTGGIWLIDSENANPVTYAGRPLSQRMTAGMLLLLSGQPLPAQLTATDATRLRSYARRLRDSDAPADLLNSWLRTRATHVSYRVTPARMRSLADNPRIAKSGISDPRTKLVIPAFEGYITSRSLRSLVRDYSLQPSTEPNVFLHATKVALPQPVMLGITIADLAMHPEYENVLVRLLNQALTRPRAAGRPKAG